MTDYLISSQHSVVVLGEMNPAIHQPAWYRQNGIITEKEEGHAVTAEKSSLILTAQISQFLIGSFTVICQPNRWEIKTVYSDQYDRIERCAAKIFDILLPHTPLSRFGTNFTLTYRLPTKVAGERLGQLVKNLGLPLPSENLVSATIKCSDQRTDFMLNTSVEPVPSSKNLIQISFNADFSPPENVPRSKIGDTLSQHRNSIESECMSCGQKIAQIIGE